MDHLDRRLLAMVGAHEGVTAGQVRLHLKLDLSESDRRVGRLCDESLVRREELAFSNESLIRVTRTGLAAIGSQLPAPGFAPSDVRHQAAVVWLWVAAWDGALGEPSRVLSRRELEGLDRAAEERAGAPTGFLIRVGGVAMYPDLAVVSAHGHRVAIYVLTWPHRSVDVEQLLAGYETSDELPDAVLFLVDTKPAQERVREVVERSALADRVHVRGAQTGAAGLRSG
jgi:hypothetical protein